MSAFSQPVIDAITNAATSAGFEPAAVLALAAVESNGVPFATVNGRNEPLIRFEGHYFDRRLSGAAREKARAAGLASPTAGAIANPSSQAARWTMLHRAIEIDAKAALESCSWGCGQVMGAHWEWLGFASVTEMVNTCRASIDGQVSVMLRYVDKAGLKGAMRAHDWDTVGRGYNGPGYKKNSYDTKLANRYAVFKRGAPAAPVADARVARLQELLKASGFPVDVDGVRGPKTDAALMQFQKSRGLVVDGVAGSATWAALEKTTPAAVPAPAKPGLFARILSFFS
ncbi:N-acetylmuramidase domain-containing protein [Aminobacter sp. MDW-2]|uniref:N-acetylmuramidase domain-containing protein n=1 Tax=Aminobacter sp. MDW-2 TaxID=2666139 RepID=UPI0012B1161E|nr:N-acetylmuramidase domain-containing protein [Aminobacter sp. MDW-2]MRX32795.1 DUF3380 domain-containing protein [Aminobacter sp. MDW-2]QNH34543.1 DUF3380 domain-containing protein [Aminobacter sp. MDW-2]